MKQNDFPLEIKWNSIYNNNNGCRTTLNHIVEWFSNACLINDGDSFILTGGGGTKETYTVAQRYNIQVSFKKIQ